MAAKLTKADKALRKLENSRFRSVDLEAGEDLAWYLDGDAMTKTQLTKRLKARRKELITAVDAIDKVLALLPDAPENVYAQDEEVAED